MLRRHASRALPFLLLGLTATAQQPTLRVETHLVTNTFTVRDARGILVSNLGRDDFSLAEDGTPQTIRLFARETDLPLSLALVVDASASQDKFLKQHLRDIQTFLSSILRPQDQVSVIGFGNHLRLVVDGASDPAVIVDAISQYDKHPGNFPEIDPDDTREGGSAVYDAIVAASGRPGNATGRSRAILLFTDGEENASAHDELDAIAAAQDADALVYAIRYTPAKHGRLTADERHGMTALHHIAEQTGGTDYDALHANLPQVFAEIAAELRALYSIGYYSTFRRRDGSFRKVVITTRDPGLAVRARAGYYAR